MHCFSSSYKSIATIILAISLIFVGCAPKSDKLSDQKFDSLENNCEKWLKSNCDSALISSNKMEFYANRFNSVKQKFRAAKMKGKVFQVIGKHDSALFSFRKMMNFAYQEKDTGDILDACSRVYLEFSSLQNYDSASFWLLKGKYISKIKKDTSMLAIFESSLGQLYLDMGNKDSALRRFLSAASYFESSNDTLNTAFSYRNIGNTLKQMGMFKDAVKYYRMALTLQQQVKNIIESAVELNNIAVVYKNIDPDSSRIYFLMSMKMLDETGSTENKLMVRFNYANLLKSTNKYKEALEIYKDVYDKSVDANILRGQIASLNLIAKTYAALNKKDDASKFFKLAIDLAKEKKLTEDMKRIYKEAFSFYLESGDIKNAKDNFEKWETISDSLNDIDQMENVIRYKTLYETEKKEKENNDLRNSVQIKARNNIMFLSLGGILLVLLVFILYVYLQRTRYLKLLISRAQLQIEQYSANTSALIPTAEEKKQESDLAKIIHKVLVEDKLCTNTQLTLDILAKTVKTNRKTLSSVINNYFGMNFNSLINFFRVEIAKKLLTDPEYKNMKMEAIGFKSGFSTRQSFYMAFNKFVGVSPAEYQQNSFSTSEKR